MTTTTATDLKAQIITALEAADSKKAENVAILQMEKFAFTDYLVICSGTNPRQVQAIVDEVQLRLKHEGAYPNSVEGYKQAEWVLLDYVDFVVHVFTEEARKFRDLERLWKSATRITAAELKSRPSRARTSPAKRAPKIPMGARPSSAKRVKPTKTASTARAIRSATSRTKSPTRKTTAAKKKSTRGKKK